MPQIFLNYIHIQAGEKTGVLTHIQNDIILIHSNEQKNVQSLIIQIKNPPRLIKLIYNGFNKSTKILRKN